MRDKLFEKQTVTNFEEVFKSKFKTVRNTDEVTRKMCPKLDYFVVFSSLSSGRGNPSQTNYGMANSALERLCEKRKLNGLPALAIQYGTIADIGVLENLQLRDAVSYVNRYF